MRNVIFCLIFVAGMVANCMPLALAEASPQLWYLELTEKQTAEDGDLRRERVMTAASQALGRELEPILVFGTDRGGCLPDPGRH